MKVSVFIERENKKDKIELEDNSNVSDLLKNLNLNPVTVIVSKNNDLVTENEKLKNNDKIKIIPVISGG